MLNHISITLFEVYDFKACFQSQYDKLEVMLSFPESTSKKIGTHFWPKRKKNNDMKSKGKEEILNYI